MPITSSITSSDQNSVEQSISQVNHTVVMSR